MHPGCRAAYGGARGQAGVRWLNFPVQATNSRASCARSCGHFRPALAAANGDPKIKSWIKCRSRARRSALLWPLRTPIALRRQRPETPAGCARRIARIPLLHMDVQLAEPGRW